MNTDTRPSKTKNRRGIIPYLPQKTVLFAGRERRGVSFAARTINEVAAG
jgi:hypothetical protein